MMEKLSIKNLLLVASLIFGIFFGAGKLAEQLSVTTRSIRNYLQEGKLHGTNAGGKWRFTEQDLYDSLYGVEENNQDQENKRIFEAPVTLKFSLITTDFYAMQKFKDTVLLII